VEKTPREDFETGERGKEEMLGKYDKYGKPIDLLGLDHCYGEGDKQIFETMVFVLMM